MSQTNQQFAEWRNSFTSVAASALISFFASDDYYLQCDIRVAFALDMSHHYRFLFSDSFPDDHLVSLVIICFIHAYQCSVGVDGHVARPTFFTSFCIADQRNFLLCYHPRAGL